MLDLLKGMKVIEIAGFMAGPTAGRILGEWGADVIKVEPIRGDSVRGCGLSKNILNGDAAGFEAINGCKRYVALDTRNPQGLEILKEMLKSCDVFLSHLRPKDAQKLGLDYDSLKEINPGIICGCTSGYGRAGAMAPRGGFDAVAYAARCGYTMDLPVAGSKPMLPYFGFGDTTCGTYLAMGVLAAYIRKLRTRQGEEVVTALMHGGMWSANFPIVSSAYGDPYPASMEGAFPMNRPYECKDGKWIALCGLMWEKSFGDLVRVAGLPEEYLQRWPDYLSAQKNCVEIAAVIQEVFLREDRDYWVKVLDEQTDIPFDICQHFSDLQKDQQAWDAGFFFEREQHSGRKVGIVTAPAQFRNAGKAEVFCDVVGAHTREVLKEYGYTDEQVDKLRVDKLVAEGDQWDLDTYNMLKHMNKK